MKWEILAETRRRHERERRSREKPKDKTDRIEQEKAESEFLINKKALRKHRHKQHSKLKSGSGTRMSERLEEVQRRKLRVSESREFDDIKNHFTTHTNVIFKVVTGFGLQLYGLQWSEAATRIQLEEKQKSLYKNIESDHKKKKRVVLSEHNKIMSSRKSQDEALFLEAVRNLHSVLRNETADIKRSKQLSLPIATNSLLSSPLRRPRTSNKVNNESLLIDYQQSRVANFLSRGGRVAPIPPTQSISAMEYYYSVINYSHEKAVRRPKSVLVKKRIYH